MNADPIPSRLAPDALHQLDTLYEHLDDSGLQPEPDESGLQIDLLPCPFYTLVDGDPDLVCRVHSQLIRDTLNQVPGPVRLLERHVDHDLCRVHLALAASRSIPATTSAPAPTSASSHSPSA